MIGIARRLLKTNEQQSKCTYCKPVKYTQPISACLVNPNTAPKLITAQKLASCAASTAQRAMPLHSSPLGLCLIQLLTLPLNLRSKL